jgi:hypothetical protein
LFASRDDREKVDDAGHFKDGSDTYGVAVLNKRRCTEVNDRGGE